jgi:hypothetical protein
MIYDALELNDCAVAALGDAPLWLIAQKLARAIELVLEQADLPCQDWAV